MQIPINTAGHRILSSTTQLQDGRISVPDTKIYPSEELREETERVAEMLPRGILALEAIADDSINLELRIRIGAMHSASAPKDDKTPTFLELSYAGNTIKARHLIGRLRGIEYCIMEIKMER
jgi:hypothetical protein